MWVRWEGLPGSGTLLYRSGGRSRDSKQFSQDSSSKASIGLRPLQPLEKSPQALPFPHNMALMMPCPCCWLCSGWAHTPFSVTSSKPRHKGSPNLLSETALRSLSPTPERIISISLLLHHCRCPHRAPRALITAMF